MRREYILLLCLYLILLIINISLTLTFNLRYGLYTSPMTIPITLLALYWNYKLSIDYNENKWAWTIIALPLGVFAVLINYIYLRFFRKLQAKSS